MLNVCTLNNAISVTLLLRIQKQRNCHSPHNPLNIPQLICLPDTVNRDTDHTDQLVLQVETVGDKYMAVSGLPEVCSSHARWIAKMALDMKDVSLEVFMEGEPIVVGTTYFNIRQLVHLSKHS